MHMSLQENEKASTLLPTLTNQANENPSQFSGPNSGDVNLQLSLGGLYDKTSSPTLSRPTSSFADPVTSMLKRSYFEFNKFMPEKVAEIKVAETLVSPLDIPVWAAQSVSHSPAFQRAINTIKSEGGLIYATKVTTSRVDTTIVPHRIAESGLQVPIFYPKNGNSIATHINNRTNPMADMLQCPPQSHNLPTHTNYSSNKINLSSDVENGTFNMQLQNMRFAAPFNSSLPTIDQLQNWTTYGGSLASLASSSSARIFNPCLTPFGTKWNNIPIMLMPQSPGVPPFIPISSGINANRAPFMPHRHQPTWPAYYTSISQPNNLNKRIKLDNNAEPELELLKQLPTKVSTEGNGKQTEGLLYKYGSNQDSVIVCMCHGCFFSPKEFVRHAGGGDVQNAMQQIYIMPYPN
ncbi:hypothetical protein M9H77_28808 [Catharanthus roseus]|uniref:Uncharacterized protein n=1 Tax=Catharanthus roseus TaxID=4058 RepID=A0ACC0AI20_CATRO|nr:hypothetical protein M9H77_28808 [Catharanthus roseus]